MLLDVLPSATEYSSQFMLNVGQNVLLCIIVHGIDQL